MRTSKTVAEAVPAESPKKKPRSAAPAAGAKKSAGRAATTRLPNRKPAARPTAAADDPQMPDQAAIDRMVAEAAYYLAEKRAFAPGFEEQDWQAARDQIAAQLRRARNPRG